MLQLHLLVKSMRYGPTTGLMRETYGYLVRGVAIFFVLFAIADMASPQFCSEQVERIPVGINALVRIAPKDAGDGSARLVATVSSPDNSLPGQPSEPATHNEDCFGCCGHILPGGIVKISVPNINTPEALIASDSQLSPPLQSTYHPPRLA